MNKTLFKVNMRSNWVMFSFIAFMLMIYTGTAIAMFDPESAEAMKAMFQMLPEGMIKAFGFVDLGTDLTTYLAGYLYGFIIMVFPLIYTVTTANSLVAGHVDKGSMAYLLSTPNTRKKIVTTQALYLIISTVALIAFVTAALILLSVIVWPGNLMIGKFIVLNIITALLLIAVAGLSFLSSCIFSDTRKSLAFGAGIPLVFVILKMISSIGDKVSFLKYFTPYSVLDTNRILNDSSYSLVVGGGLVVAAVIIYALAIAIFSKKDLTI